MSDGESRELRGADAERRFFADEPELDPYDLSGLRPRPDLRKILLALAVIFACSYLLYDQRLELSYFLKGSSPEELGALEQGTLRQQLAGGELPSNLYVRLDGRPNYPPFLWESPRSWGRGPGAGEHARLLTFPEAEEQRGGLRHIGETVQLTYLPLAVVYYEQNSYPREHLRSSFEGRLVRAKDAPFLDPIRHFLWKTYALEVPGEAYVLLDGERPLDNWVHALISGLALAAIAFNLIVLARQLARRPAGNPSAKEA